MLAKRAKLIREIRAFSGLHDHLPPTYQAALDCFKDQLDSSSSSQHPSTSTLEAWLTVMGPLYRTVANNVITAGRQGLQTITKFLTFTSPDSNHDKYPP